MYKNVDEYCMGAALISVQECWKLTTPTQAYKNLIFILIPFKREDAGFTNPKVYKALASSKFGMHLSTSRCLSVRVSVCPTM